MAKKDDNLLEPIFDLAKSAWRHRPEVTVNGKTFFPAQEIVAPILDTIDAIRLENKDGLKPLLLKRIKTSYGAKLLFNLPPGISKKDFESKLNHFEEQAKGQIFLSIKGKTLIMSVNTAELPKMVPFEYKDNDCNIPIPIGKSAEGIYLVDLVDVPHMLIAGQTGGGKSTFLHVLACYLLLKSVDANREIKPAIIDLKMLEFAYLSEHCLVIDDQNAAGDLLVWLNKELDRRLRVLRDARCRKITQYKGEMPFIVLIIDELAELTDKNSQEDLNRLVRLARAAGIHVVASTQRPDATLFKDFAKTRALLPGRLCYTVADEVNSRIVLGNNAADKIPKDTPGRSVWKWDDEVIVQGMYLGEKEAEDLVATIPAKGGINLEQRQKRLPPR